MTLPTPDRSVKSFSIFIKGIYIVLFNRIGFTLYLALTQAGDVDCDVRTWQ